MLYLIDSSAVINELNFEFQKQHTYITTPLIFDEFRDIRTKNLAENALHYGTLKISESTQASLKKAQEKVSEFGFTKLSKADISLIALAIDYKNKKEKFFVITDDYSIQNFLKLLKIPFKDVLQGRIKEVIKFSLRCPACNTKVATSSDTLECPNCGTKLRKSIKSH